MDNSAGTPSASEPTPGEPPAGPPKPKRERAIKGEFAVARVEKNTTEQRLLILVEHLTDTKAAERWIVANIDTKVKPGDKLAIIQIKRASIEVKVERTQTVKLA